MHCASGSWPRTLVELELPPMLSGSQHEQGASHSGGHPRVSELFLHCALSCLTESICGHPVSGRPELDIRQPPSAPFLVHSFIGLCLSQLSGLCSLSHRLSCLRRRAVFTDDSVLLFQARKQSFWSFSVLAFQV